MAMHAGFDGNKMFYCLATMGFYFVAVYTVTIKHTWGVWFVPKKLKVPSAPHHPITPSLIAITDLVVLPECLA